MQTERPASVLVMAILNIILGSWLLLSLLCSGFGIGVMYMMSNTPRGPLNPTAGMLQEMEKELPGYTVILIGSLAISLVFCILLIVCGVGLLSLRRWARLGCLILAVITAVQQVLGVIANYLWVAPAMAKWNHRVLEEMKAQPGPFGASNPGMELGSNPLVANLSTFLTAGATIVYCLILIWVLFKPNVRQAFAQRASVLPQPGTE